MSQNQASNKSQHIYRVDKFIVPTESREIFIEKVQDTHKLLRTQPGFLQDFIFEQSHGPGDFNFITVVEWENMEAVENAGEAVKAMHQKMNFNPRKVLPQLDIKADVGYYENFEL